MGVSTPWHKSCKACRVVVPRQTRLIMEPLDLSASFSNNEVKRHLEYFYLGARIIVPLADGATARRSAAKPLVL